MLQVDKIKKDLMLEDFWGSEIHLQACYPCQKCSADCPADFEAVKEKASMITPVPGGMGPTIIPTIMMNTVQAAKLAAGIRE